MAEKWIFPCNPKYFDIAKHFETNDVVCFKRKGTTRNGDIAYIYISSTLKQLKYKCIIVDEDVQEPLLSQHKYVIKDDPYSTVKPHYTAMKLVETIDDGLYTLDWLRQHGTNQFTVPMRLPKQTVAAIEEQNRITNNDFTM